MQTHFDNQKKINQVKCLFGIHTWKQYDKDHFKHKTHTETPHVFYWVDSPGPSGESIIVFVRISYWWIKKSMSS